MFRFRLPVRAVASRQLRSARFVRAALTCTWVALAFWLLAAGATITAVRSPASTGQQLTYGENQAPRFLYLYAYYQGDGCWLICGQVWDDKNPAGMTVELSGGPLPEPEYCTVQMSGTFCRSVQIIGPGAIFANTMDFEGLPAPEAFTSIGY